MLLGCDGRPGGWWTLIIVGNAQVPLAVLRESAGAAMLMILSLSPVRSMHCGGGGSGSGGIAILV